MNDLKEEITKLAEDAKELPKALTYLGMFSNYLGDADTALEVQK